MSLSTYTCTWDNPCRFWRVDATRDLWYSLCFIRRHSRWINKLLLAAGAFNEFGILSHGDTNIIVTGIFFFMCKLDLLTVMQCQARVFTAAMMSGGAKSWTMSSSNCKWITLQSQGNVRSPLNLQIPQGWIDRQRERVFFKDDFYCLFFLPALEALTHPVLVVKLPSLNKYSNTLGNLLLSFFRTGTDISSHVCVLQSWSCTQPEN